MPTAYIKELAREGHGSIETLEKHWNEAKKRAAAAGHGDDYAYITGIFQKISGVKASVAAAFQAELVAAFKGGTSCS